MSVNMSAIDTLIQQLILTDCNKSSNVTETSNPVFNRNIEVLFICFTGCIILSGILVNLSILILFLGKRQSLSPANVLLGSLAASNCIACVIVLPVVLGNIISPPITHFGMVCDIFSFLRQMWWISNNYALLFISYDKLKFISCPLKYQRIMTSRKAIVFIIITWAITVVLSVVPMIGWTHYAYDKEQYYCSLNLDNNILFNVLYMGLSFWTPCAIIIFCYVSIIWYAQGNIQRLAALMEASSIYQNNSRSQSIFKTVKTSCLVIITFLVAWLPYFIMVLFHNTPNINLCKTFRFASIMIYLPIFVYPYLFAFRNKTLRLELSMLYAKVNFWRDVRKIHPAPNIDEQEYPENVSRRNSRTESLNTEKRLSRQGSSIMLGMYQRESGMTSVGI